MIMEVGVWGFGKGDKDIHTIHDKATCFTFGCCCDAVSMISPRSSKMRVDGLGEAVV